MRTWDGRETLVGRRGAALVGLCQRKVGVELEERQYLLFALMLPKELGGSVVVADDDIPIRLAVKSV